MINLLGDLQRRLGVAIVFIAHDLSVVRHIADRVAVMYLGRIAEIGDTSTIYDSPAHPYTQALLSAVPASERSARGRMTNRRILDGEPPSPVNPPPGCRFNPRCPLASGKCRTEIPALRELGGDRSSACHFAETVVSHAVADPTVHFGLQVNEDDTGRSR